jgi:hypothetical protein
MALTRRALDPIDVFLKLHPYLNELMGVKEYFGEYGEHGIGCYSEIGIQAHHTPQQIMELLLNAGFLDHLPEHERWELLNGNIQLVGPLPPVVGFTRMNATEDSQKLRNKCTRLVDYADEFLKLHPYLNELMSMQYGEYHEGGECVWLVCLKKATEPYCFIEFHIIFRDAENFNYRITGEDDSELASETSKVTPQQLIGFLQKEGFLDHLTAHEHAALVAGNLQMIPERPREW